MNTRNVTLTIGEASDFTKAVHELVGNLSGNTVAKISRNVGVLSRAFPNVHKIYREMFIKHGSPKEGTEAHSAFMVEQMEHQEGTTITVELETIRYDELLIGVGKNANHFSPAMVNALSSMIDYGEGQ